MDALKFLNEVKRMCEFYTKGYDCDDCPLCKKDGLLCDISELSYDKHTQVLSLVEKWSKEHPKRTYLSVLLEKFPKTVLNEFGIPSFCPSYLGFKEFQDARCGEYERCENCWNKEYKEK